jgi:hypothetical protein
MVSERGWNPYEGSDDIKLQQLGVRRYFVDTAFYNRVQGKVKPFLLAGSAVMFLMIARILSALLRPRSR